LARSTSASPRGVIRPSAIRRSACSQLTFDQMLRARRGVKRWSHTPSASPLRFWLSIQPCASATCSASG